jgi:hypothetical protein
MGTRKTGSLPARLEAARRRFEVWRRTRKVRTRIPESLWASAVRLATTYGIHRTSKALRVDYYSLKKRVEKDASSLPDVPEGGAVGTFLELAAPASAGFGECILELEDASGATMRVHLKGVAAPDLAALSRSFWGVES